MDEPVSQKRTFNTWDRVEGDTRVPPPRNAADRFIRTFRFPAYVLSVLVLYGLGCLALGLSLAPAAWVLYRLGSYGFSLTNWLRWPVVGLAVGLSLFVFAFTLLVLVPILNWVLPTRIRPYKGSYFTLAALPWFVHNGLFYLVRFTVLPFATLTPFGLWFLKGMGMKVGKRAFVNTEVISDPRLITLGDDVALGGSVRIVAHYGGGGNLVIAPVTIGNRTTVGLAATIMGDVIIGSNATILPHSVLLPGSRVGDGETWGGVPARPISREEMDQLKEIIRGAQGTA